LINFLIITELVANLIINIPFVKAKQDITVYDV